ncbi:MAG: TPM domain-containing protein [Smithellaceae bacterium]
MPGATAVNDFAHVIDPANVAKMESLAEEILQKTSTAMVVVTVPELGENEDISLYVNGLYKAWGIGRKGEDKGLLIFLAVKERQIRIETGYGVEGILPDGLVGQILDRFVMGYLQENEYGKGLYNALFSCAIIIAKDAGLGKLSSVSNPYVAKAPPRSPELNLLGLFFFLIAAAVLLGTKSGRRMLPWILLMLVSGAGRGSGGGGGFGGGFGGFGGGMSGGGGAGRSF